MTDSSARAIAKPTVCTCDETYNRPDALYLREVVRTVMSDTKAPADLRGACQQLMLVINANDLNQIEDRLDDLHQVADAHRVPLPARSRQTPVKRTDAA
jgi:hypothetical protein